MKKRKKLIFLIIFILLGTAILFYKYSPYYPSFSFYKNPNYSASNIAVQLPSLPQSSEIPSFTIDRTDYSAILSEITYQPLLDSSVKGFTRDENLFLNDPSVREIYNISGADLLRGNCMPFAYNQAEKIFKSTDRTHPRYGGAQGQELNPEQSKKVLLAMLQLRQGITKSIGNISYCYLGKDMYVRDANSSYSRIVLSLPTKDQPDHDLFVGLLDSNLKLIGGAKIKTPSDSNYNPDPIAYNYKANIFYLKLSGKLFGGDVNLFRINFGNNTYKTLYQGK